MGKVFCVMVAAAAMLAATAQPAPAAKSFCAPGMPGARVCAGYKLSLNSLLGYYVRGRSPKKAVRIQALNRLKAYWINSARRKIIKDVAKWPLGAYKASYNVTFRQIAFASDTAAELTTQETWDVRGLQGGYVPLIEVRVTHVVVLLRSASGRWRVTSYT